MSVLTEDKQALTYRVDGLHDFVTHIGLQGYCVETFQGRDDARGQARALAGCRACGRGKE